MTHDDLPIWADDAGAGMTSGEALASQVIAELCGRRPDGPNGPRVDILDGLVDHIVSRQPFDAETFCTSLLSKRVNPEQLLKCYFPEAARRLGEAWLDDSASFATVTVGALRLQSLVNELRYRAPPQSHDRSALIVVTENEQHFLGSIVLSALVERLGFEVETSIYEASDAIAERVRLQRPDILMFSCSQASKLATVNKTVQYVRNAVRPAPVIALGGPVVGKVDGLKELTGVDIVTCELSDVIEVCDARSDNLRRR